MVLQSKDGEVAVLPLGLGGIPRTGIRSVDVQHQELVALIGQFEAAHFAGESANALQDVLPQLETYALFHFMEEERLMETLVGEAVFVQMHLEQHHEFVRQIKQMTAELAHHDAVHVAAALVDYLRKWLLQHIATTDVALSRKLLSPHYVAARH